MANPTCGALLPLPINRRPVLCMRTCALCTWLTPPLRGCTLKNSEQTALSVSPFIHLPSPVAAFHRFTPWLSLVDAMIVAFKLPISPSQYLDCILFGCLVNSIHLSFTSLIENASAIKFVFVFCVMQLKGVRVALNLKYYIIVSEVKHSSNHWWNITALAQDIPGSMLNSTNLSNVAYMWC